MACELQTAVDHKLKDQLNDRINDAKCNAILEMIKEKKACKSGEHNEEDDDRPNNDTSMQLHGELATHSGKGNKILDKSGCVKIACLAPGPATIIRLNKRGPKTR